MKKKSFSSTKEIIQFAIEREEEAALHYGKLARKAKDTGVKTLLKELQEDERRHKKILQGLTSQKIGLALAKDVADLKISDYLVEEALAPEMNFQDLLIFAAKKEQRAAELYDRLAKKVKDKDKDKKKLFQFLVKQEKSHKLRLEIEYDKHVLWED